MKDRMQRLLFLAVFLPSILVVAEEIVPVPADLRTLKATFPESSEADPSKTVVHFVTNRLLIGALKNEPKWKTFAASKLFLAATDRPVVGYTVVQHNGTPDKPNDANLDAYSIESFHPRYRVRVDFHEDRFSPITNEVADDGLASLQSYWKRNVLIYVHGFNNDWHTAIKRAAQIKRDLRKKYQEDFSILVYSWPSLGGGGFSGVLAYTDDERRYRETLPAFSKFLDAVLLKGGNTQGRGKRWVLAHSMGNRVFLHGFAAFGLEKEVAMQSIPPDLFTRVVLAAPDMEAEDFKTHTQYLYQFCANPKPLMYFHAASNIAVNASELKHLDTRAGVKGVTSDFLLTIDAQGAKSPLSELGHGYYASNDKMVDLIAGYFFGNADPSTSADLERVDSGRFRLK
jgi:hypothetical protein